MPGHSAQIHEKPFTLTHERYVRTLGGLKAEHERMLNEHGRTPHLCSDATPCRTKWLIAYMEQHYV